MTRLLPSALFTILLLSCGDGEVEPREFRGTLDNLAGQHVVHLWAEGWAGEVHFVIVEIAESDPLWVEDRRCASQVGWTVTMNGLPLTQTIVGGLAHVVHTYCNVGTYWLEVDASEWTLDDDVTIAISDAVGGSEELRFLNFIAPPEITVIDPLTTEVHRGDAFTLRVLPSVRMFSPVVTLAQGGFGSGTLIAQGLLEDYRIDDTSMRFTVPETAHADSTESLRFFTGSGWSVVPLDCGLAASCDGARVRCPDAGCGSHGIHIDGLDDDARLVPFHVLP